MKKLFLISLLLAPIFSHANTMVHNGCQYQGEITQQKPHGKGVLTCADGRIYTGAFANGEFHGAGQFVAPNTPNVFLSPFGMRSGKLKGYVLIGRFEKGTAVGLFKVYQNGKHLFNMQFEKGMLQAITPAK